MSLISFNALEASLYDMLSCFHFISLTNFLFLRFSLATSVIILFKPFGIIFLFHLHIILDSAISSSFSMNLF
jgi:hypothetical protein